MKKRKKLAIVTEMALVACISVGSFLPVSALERGGQADMALKADYIQESNITILPRYEVLRELDVKLAINSSGYASCSGVADTRTSYTCDANLELQKKSGSVWKTVKEWNSSGRTNSFDKGYYVTSGYDYRLKLSADVYTSSGSWVEGATTYSQIVHY